MAARVVKHTHTDRVIAHTLDRERVLLMCKSCPRTETLLLSKAKTQMGPRKYRPATKQEFFEQFKGMEHICCG
jgi:hypothetical protein